MIYTKSIKRFLSFSQAGWKSRLRWCEPQSANRMFPQRSIWKEVAAVGCPMQILDDFGDSIDARKTFTRYEIGLHILLSTPVFQLVLLLCAGNRLHHTSSAHHFILSFHMFISACARTYFGEEGHPKPLKQLKRIPRINMNELITFDIISASIIPCALESQIVHYAFLLPW